MGNSGESQRECLNDSQKPGAGTPFASPTVKGVTARLGILQNSGEEKPMTGSVHPVLLDAFVTKYER